MKYEVVEDFESIFHDHYDENGDIVYMSFVQGDILDGEVLPFTDLSLAMIAEDGQIEAMR